MASPPPEWSGAPRPGERDGNPAAFRLLRELEAQWLASESVVRYPRLVAQALTETAATVTELTPGLRVLVAELPGEYTAQVRPAAPYLFLCWMPVGYASILAVDAPEALPPATTAMMHYGAAITVLDDIADTDHYDTVWGEGTSDIVADFAATHGLPAPAGLLPAIPPEARWAVDYAASRLKAFRGLAAHFRAAPALTDQFEAVIATFLASVRTCRRVRRRIAEGAATPSELQALADAAPHGMTVVMVALLSAAQRGVTDRTEIQQILDVADIAQKICHYQNALATLEREVRDRDPSNPIVLDAMQKGHLEQRSFMDRGHPLEQTLSAVEASRRAFENRLASMERDFHERTRSENGRFLHRFGFGVSNLHLLYRIAWGQI